MRSSKTSASSLPRVKARRAQVRSSKLEWFAHKLTEGLREVRIMVLDYVPKATCAGLVWKARPLASPVGLPTVTVQKDYLREGSWFTRTELANSEVALSQVLHPYDLGRRKKGPLVHIQAS